jgi:4-amino-4-deoxy-L-arabinose transferase-like glycosyltransferase
MLFHAAMNKGLNHDENMYVAAGALVAREGLAPYLDFTYFQMPYLPYLYALAFSISDHLLLSARIISVLCSGGIATLVYWAGWKAAHGRAAHVRLAVATVGVLLLLANPAYAHASGIAWNHDPAIFAALLSFTLLATTFQRAGATVVLASGILLGVAIGLRLTLAFALVPFFAFLLVRPGVSRAVRRAGLFAAGLATALAPALVLFALDPDLFLFSNLGYHAANEHFWWSTGHTQSMDFTGKLAYLFQAATAPGSLSLLALVAVTTGLIRVSTGRDKIIATFALGTGGALLLGQFATSPTWLQYFYAPVPFLIVAVQIAVTRLVPTRRANRVMLSAFGVVGAWALIVTVGAYARPGNLLRPEEWVPVAAHREGVALREVVLEGRVLTLAPLYPLEGRLGVYRHLASGPFGWRVSPQLSQEDRRRYVLAGPEELAVLNPVSVLTGYEGALEDPIREYAASKTFSLLPFGEGKSVYIKP